MNAVHLRGAVCLLGRFPALAGLDLDVERGEVVLLQGPNGAGKSTVLRLCAGLLALETGTGSVLGFDLRRDRRSVRERVGLLGHATGLYEELTAEENVRFWARAVGAEAREVDVALDYMGVSGRVRDTPAGKLSAGQRRRTSIAAVVVRRPELWLLDEPHAGLDQAGRDVVDRLIIDAAAAGGTVMVASHELERVRPLSPRMVTVAGGVVHADMKAPARTAGPEGSPHVA